MLGPANLKQGILVQNPPPNPHCALRTAARLFPSSSRRSVGIPSCAGSQASATPSRRGHGEAVSGVESSDQPIDDNELWRGCDRRTRKLFFMEALGNCSGLLLRTLTGTGKANSLSMSICGGSTGWVTRDELRGGLIQT
ncbi:uncharacterized protein LOC122014004 [Zingiber officinale]|uniref:uncharacterized protein LOC122014004 n=1 Tax=Zingiber officinale TaxID=94328 RepID=UPI001C4B1083|nr:uncharacterized protein LOC122014004 [Zingiber officinale]